jgi:hypothetical protein
MTETKPIVTFHTSVRSPASPATIYDVLSDARTHLVWAGQEAPRKNFRLLTMDAAAGPLSVGDSFSSTGENGNGTFQDRSVVVEADRDARFGFDTESTLVRKHAKAWHVRFAHRYALASTPDGTDISYTCEVRPQNYVPWWLRPGVRSMTGRMVPRMMQKHLENLARMAESAVPQPEA